MHKVMRKHADCERNHVLNIFVINIVGCIFSGRITF